MFRSLLIGIVTVTLLAACSTGPQPDEPAAATPAAERPAQRPTWLIGDPGRLLARLDQAQALVELAVPVLPTPAPASASRAGTGAQNAEAQAPMPTPRRVTLPANGAPIPTPSPTAAPSELLPRPASRDAQAPWARPVPAWVAQGLAAAARTGQTPNRAARDLAILSAALDDSYAVLDAARAQRLDLSEDALLAAAARATLSVLYPADTTRWERSYAVAVWMGVWNRQDSAQAVANGVLAGRAVAAAALERVRDDGSAAPQIFDWPEALIPPGEPTPVPPIDRWRPTLPNPPIDPLWGQVRLIGLKNADGLAAAPPPNWDAVAFANTRSAFQAAQRALTDEQRALARAWSGSGVAQWAGLAQTLAAEAQLDGRATARLYAVLGATLHNAYVVSWADSYRYLVPRPTNWMRAGDAAWSASVAAPATPSYPSEVAVTAYAAADILGDFFPAQQARIAATADEAARSQLYAGVHWQIDVDAGVDQGHRVGQAMRALIHSTKTSAVR